MTSADGPIHVMPAADDRGGEGRVLGQEAVARVDRIATRRPGGVDDPVDVEVGLGGCGAAEADRVVGQFDGHRPGVGLAVDDDRGGADLMARPDHADGDLAAVGDEHAGHHARLTISGPPRGAN